MLNVYCWRCGTQINEESVLGIGHFDQKIGKYHGKGFIAFKCPECQKVRYHISDFDMMSIKKLVRKHINSMETYPEFKQSDGIDINNVIDFYQILSEIETVDSFLEKCRTSVDLVSPQFNRPIIQPLDVYNLFKELNNSNMKRLLILTLDDDNYLVTWEFLGEGTNKPISFDPKIIFHTPFLLEDKVSVIIAENINDSLYQPTQKDILISKKLVKAGKLLGIDFLDHIIVENNGYHSFDQLNLL